jgi:uncharacterized SAM-binding protein YcdF (DUF218 family)
MPPESSPDAVVVLGAQVLSSGQPSPALRRRIGHAVEVWRATPGAVLVGTGGPGRAPVSEAEVIRRAAVAAGVPESRVVVEDRSTTTLEQAVAVAAEAAARGWRSLALVTDGYHMPRSLFLFRRMGLEVHGEAVHGRGAASRRRWAQGALREIPAWAKALLLVAVGYHRRPAARPGDPG